MRRPWGPRSGASRRGCGPESLSEKVLTPFITYTLATKLDVSGPLAEVVADLLVWPLKGGPP